MSLAVTQLHGGYGQGTVLNGVALSVRPGEMVALLGPNGAGKSSVLRALCVGLPVLTGQIKLDGQDMKVTSAKWRKAAAETITYIPEGRGIFPSLTVAEHLFLGARGRREDFKRGCDKVYPLFPFLQERSSQAAGMLSGGEQQMLAIARCIMSKPRFIFVDEPSLGLAPVAVKAVLEHLRRISSDEQVGIVLAEQSASVLHVCDVVHVLSGGRVAYSGSPASLDAQSLFELFLRPSVADADSAGKRAVW